ncbi:MAG: hypothetical protein WBG17_04475, partial [Burkholderiaceae bacterium]
AVKALCLSAAEKRDYAAFPRTRQLLFYRYVDHSELPHPLHFPCPPSRIPPASSSQPAPGPPRKQRDANYIKGDGMKASIQHKKLDMLLCNLPRPTSLFWQIFCLIISFILSG